MIKKLSSFLDLNVESFHDRTIFLDVDGTIVPDHGTKLDAAAIDKVRELKEHNIIILASNGLEVRTKALAGDMNVSYLATSKPRVGTAQLLIGKNPLVIGDKYLTDGLFAKFLSADFIQVKHLKSKKDSFFIRIIYFFDDIVSTCAPYIEIMRPWQWVKNLLVFAPLLFALDLFNPFAFWRVTLTFAAFCVAASAMYVCNDILDQSQDYLHPKKRFRPITSGALTTTAALVLLIFLAVIECVLIYFIPAIAWIVAGYVALNIAYSTWFKHVAVIDIFVVAVFYLLRILAGGLSARVPLSPWIILCVLFGSLFVIIGKRRAEYAHTSRRTVLETYSTAALDYMLAAAAALTIMAYGVYSVVGHDLPYLVYSTAFVAFVLFRMMNCIYTNPAEAESPEILVFTDPWILFGFALWLVYVFSVFYVV